MYVLVGACTLCIRYLTDNGRLVSLLTLSKLLRLPWNEDDSLCFHPERTAEFVLYENNDFCFIAVSLHPIALKNAARTYTLCLKSKTFNVMSISLPQY